VRKEEKEGEKVESERGMDRVRKQSRNKKKRREAMRDRPKNRSRHRHVGKQTRTQAKQTKQPDIER
jgi:hypothetical protein